MSSRKVLSRLLIAMVVAGAGVVTMPLMVTSSSSVLAAENGSTDAQMARAVQERLKNKKFSGVTVMADNGTVTLSGQVDLDAYKEDAVKQAKKASGVQTVRDNIAVGGKTIPDAVLERKLVSAIQVDRIGFGQVFDAISVHVHEGVVTLGGHALGPVAKSSAIALTRNTPGVKGVVDQISVDPVSGLDNRIRRATYHAIYGFPSLRRYALVPSRPIRISVQNGHVTLYGVVYSEMDKQIAYTRARQVPGVFSVTNELMVDSSQGKNSEGKKK